MTKLLHIILLTTCLCALSCTKESTLVVSGRVELDDMRIGSRIGGRIESVNFKEGEAVHKGDIIIQLEPEELAAQLTQAKAQESQAKAQLDLLLAGSRKEDIAHAEAVVQANQATLQLRQKGFRTQEVQQAQASLNSARSDLELAHQDFERFQSLYNQKVISKAEFDRSRTTFETAQAKVQAAQEQLSLMKSGSRPEEITSASAQLAQSVADLERLKNGARPEEIEAARAVYASAQANVAKLQQQWDEMQIRAPLDSYIESLDLHPGDLVKPGDTVAVLNMKTNPYVRCYIPENQLGHVRQGMDVWISIDTFPREKFTGKVRRIATVGEFTPRNVQTTEKRSELVYEMKVDILNGLDKIRPGMFADVHIPRANAR